MALYIPKKIVLNWYQYDVGFSIELIESFANRIAKQAAESIVNYQERKQIEVELDDETWDLPKIFLEYFPSLLRRSALLTVCGYFENELDKLSLLYQAEKAFSPGLSDLMGTEMFYVH